ncbi:MAG: NAD(P)-binding domain-containing protein [Gemmatimonadota bacterium]|jgi:thioredoxin reductase (NADPH)
MDGDAVIIVGVGVALVLITGLPFLMRLRRTERETEEAQVQALKYGLHEPVSLHPVVDPAGCIGISNCVSACPEGVLGIRTGQAVAVSPARCIGHGLCERVCPMDAIQLVFGSEQRGVDLPRVRENFETNVEGLYIVGELGGMGLVANAFEQGRQCIEGILSENGGGGQGLLDLVIVGCGPAGLSASLTAQAHGLSFVTLEKEDLGGTVRHYPRKKLVMTRPVKVPGYGKLPVRQILKEELIDLWEDIAGRAGLQVQTGRTVTSLDRVGSHHFRVSAGDRAYEARRVILAIGRRGVPRKLGVPGEDRAPHVSYSLREPEAYQGDRILVVGGGDSAVEAALALADQPGNEVRVSYRRDGFSRIKPANHERVQEAITQRRIDVLWSTVPQEIGPDRVLLSGPERESFALPANQVFVFIGGELPTAFLRACGVTVETHFGAP